MREIGDLEGKRDEVQEALEKSFPGKKITVNVFRSGHPDYQEYIDIQIENNVDYHAVLHEATKHTDRLLLSPKGGNVV